MQHQMVGIIEKSSDSMVVVVRMAVVVRPRERPSGKVWSLM